MKKGNDGIIIQTARLHFQRVIWNARKHMDEPSDVNGRPIYYEIVACKSQNNCHGYVSSADKELSKQNWKKYVQIEQEYTDYRDGFICILKDFWLTWDGHIGRINVAKRRIKIDAIAQHSVQSAPYPSRHKEKESEVKRRSNACLEGYWERLKGAWYFHRIRSEEGQTAYILCPP